jgi:hypothetical protein
VLCVEYVKGETRMWRSGLGSGGAPSPPEVDSAGASMCVRATTVIA